MLWSINRPVDYYGWWDAYEGRGWIVADGKRIYTVGYTQTEANKWLYKLLFECRSLDGVLLWSWEDLVGDFDQGCNGITIEQNTIYITYSNNIIAKINIETGSLMWAISYSDFHIGGIYVSGNSLYAHGADLLHSSYKIMRLDKNDGSIKWEKVYGTAIAGGIEVPAGAIGVVDNFIYSNSSILSAIGGEFPNYLFTVSTKGDQLNKVDIGRTFLSDKLPIDEGVGVWTMSLAWPTPTGELLGKSMTTKTVKEEVL